MRPLFASRSPCGVVFATFVIAFGCSNSRQTPDDAGGGDVTTLRDVGVRPDAGDGGADAEDCSSDWQCAPADEDGRVFCRVDRGLPAFGFAWQCHLATIEGTRTWFCTGHSPVGYDPLQPTRCQGPWRCDRVTTVGEISDPPMLPTPGYDYIMRCQRPEEPTDRPPGVTDAVCVKGSQFRGTRCEVLSAPPVRPGPADPCTPGTRMWCDGSTYDGWGTVTCTADGRWATRINSNGQATMDCVELTSGEVPATGCACYFPFFDPVCCEREDCLVPEDAKTVQCEWDWGEACTPCYAGNDLCGPDNRCIVTASTEMFCSEPCDDSGRCKAGFRCETATLATGDVDVCVPDDLSCYF